MEDRRPLRPLSCIAAILLGRLVFLWLYAVSIAFPARALATATVTNLRNFDRTYPVNPQYNLTEAGDGNFYGVTSTGGEYGNGSVDR